MTVSVTGVIRTFIFDCQKAKTYTIRDDLVLPAAIKIIEILYGSKHVEEIRKIPLKF